MSRKVCRSIVAKLARGAIGASSMRGAGSAGVVESVRASLLKVPLTGFGTRDPVAFRKALNKATNNIKAALPKQARHWGLARKGLNIFLRDCLYTVYIREAYSLHLAEQWFEVPLDSITGTKLHTESEGRAPRWRSVRGLTPSLSRVYQAEARRLAKIARVAPVHLDAIWWGERLEEDEG